MASISGLVRALLAAGGLLLILTPPAAAQQAEVLADGRMEYEENCVACHGTEGRGDGPMAELLIVPPADLTTIAARNDGRFPFWRVYRVIDGREPVKGHDTFQMPLTGTRFERDEGKPGYLPAHIRVLLLTHYLESLQGEQPKD